MEKVLVAETAHLKNTGLCEEGYWSDPMPLLRFLTTPGCTRFMNRDRAEKDQACRQVIPFFVVKLYDGILITKRSSTQGDERLRGKMSLIIGGHVNAEDSATGEYCHGLDVLNAIITGAQRELIEELDIQTPSSNPRCEACFAGVVNEDETEAGRTHIGLPILLDLCPGTKVRPAANDFEEFEFVSHLRLVGGTEDRALTSQLETWSSLIALNLPSVMSAGDRVEKQPILSFLI